MHVSILFYERLCDSENPPKDIELRNFSFVLFWYQVPTQVKTKPRKDQKKSKEDN